MYAIRVKSSAISHYKFEFHGQISNSFIDDFLESDDFYYCIKLRSRNSSFSLTYRSFDINAFRKVNLEI